MVPSVQLLLLRATLWRRIWMKVARPSAPSSDGIWNSAVAVVLPVTALKLVTVAGGLDANDDAASARVPSVVSTSMRFMKASPSRSAGQSVSRPAKTAANETDPERE